MSLVRFELSSGPAVRWSLRLMEAPAELAEARVVAEREIAAEVPGCVHTDLVCAGLLEDPYLGTNELRARWIGECSWRYTAHFELPDSLFREVINQEHTATTNALTRFDLVFDGIDTLAMIRLNGILVGAADNMHATWRFDVRKALRRGANVLEIDLPAPLPHCRSELERYRREIGDFPFGGAGANPQLPHHMLRKMHCNFGWDWGPQLVTCGIWRPARLEAWAARIGSVRPRVLEASESRAVVEVWVDAVEAMEHVGTAPARLKVALLDPEARPVVFASSSPRDAVQLVVEQPRLWWPAGHGEQPLYRLVVSLQDADAGELDRFERTIGLRTFEWMMTPDEAPATVAGAVQPQGATFHLRVNGRRIFCKGANWIPDDCFPHRVTPERYYRRIQQARDANMNMLRVWGGGIYEAEAFYDACDELGVMVWQDFATACSCYPEDEAFKRRFEHEARDNVSRLAGRASLALWCGGNECIQAVYDWGPEYRRMRQVNYGWGMHYWYELFPRIVAELDPGTFYWPNSPWSGSDDLPPNLESIGDCHIWDVWNGQGDWRNYWSHAPRFASEFGFHGPPTWPILQQAIPPDQRHWFSESCTLHNKQEGGQARAIERAREHFTLPPRPASPESFEAMWFLAALNQARAIEAGCQWFRALSPWCGGALFWQLNDCWPVASWSAIDNDSRGEGLPKLLWYAARRFFAPRMCALLPDGPLAGMNSGASPRVAGAEPRPRVYLHNDSLGAWAGALRLRLVSFDGETVEEEEAPFEIEPGASLRFIVPGHWQGAPERLLVAQATAAHDAHWFFGRDKDLPYPPPRFELSVVENAGNVTALRISAQTLVRDLCLFPQRLEPQARASNQLITLLPGQVALFDIHGCRPLTAVELLSPGIIWSANLFGQSGTSVSRS